LHLIVLGLNDKLNFLHYLYAVVDSSGRKGCKPLLKIIKIKKNQQSNREREKGERKRELFQISKRVLPLKWISTLILKSLGRYFFWWTISPECIILPRISVSTPVWFSRYIC